MSWGTSIQIGIWFSVAGARLAVELGDSGLEVDPACVLELRAILGHLDFPLELGSGGCPGCALGRHNFLSFASGNQSQRAGGQQ